MSEVNTEVNTPVQETAKPVPSTESIRPEDSKESSRINRIVQTAGKFFGRQPVEGLKVIAGVEGEGVLAEEAPPIPDNEALQQEEVNGLMQDLSDIQAFRESKGSGGSLGSNPEADPLLQLSDPDGNTYRLDFNKIRQAFTEKKIPVKSQLKMLSELMKNGVLPQDVDEITVNARVARAKAGESTDVDLKREEQYRTTRQSVIDLFDHIPEDVKHEFGLPNKDVFLNRNTPDGIERRGREYTVKRWGNLIHETVLELGDGDIVRGTNAVEQLLQDEAINRTAQSAEGEAV